MPSDNGNNKIKRLPDLVASQIAAGEVVQRPASVVKELLENAIDAGASRIDIVLKDAGRTLIQVTDNGCGMSADDSVTAFERHATSKINTADDLYDLHTMGFRGEALYSIAAVAEVELHTRRINDELGSKVIINGGVLQSQEFIACNAGTQISVRHLFFNVPARRKFLKSNETELRNIIHCFEQISLFYNNIAFTLSNNGALLYKLNPEGRLQRISSVMGKKLGNAMIALEADTILVKISGFVGTTEVAQKRGANQFFFVNGRYIQHPYFAKAVANAYDRIIPAEYRPSFFIFLEVEPSAIDVNIHPTKTEVKFSDEQAIFPILCACVKEALNKTNMIPRLDFDGSDSRLIPELKKNNIEISTPYIEIDSSYDPFKAVPFDTHKGSAVSGWEKLYNNEDNAPDNDMFGEPKRSLFPIESSTNERSALMIGSKYIAYSDDFSIYIYNLHRANFQLLYAKFMETISKTDPVSRQLLIPDLLEFTPKDDIAFGQIKPVLEKIGFEFSDFGKYAYQVTALPATVESIDVKEYINNLINSCNAHEDALKINENIAASLAKHAAAACKYNENSAKQIVKQLQEQGNPRYTCQGNPIFFEINESELKSRFNQ